MKTQVALVGAGPGDIDLITVKALRYIQQADVIIYDRLVNHELLDAAKAQCEKIYVGKQKDFHSKTQDEIQDLMIERALQNKFVVRLKGGDPFIFGRGGEEVDALNTRGISWEVVPGITAATGAAASQGLALSERSEIQAITFITAHKKHGQLDIDWPLVLREHQSVVFYMGLSLLSEIVKNLLDRGKPNNTPFSIVCNASTPTEHCYSGELNTILELVRHKLLPSPALLIMGPKKKKMNVAEKTQNLKRISKLCY